MTKAGDLFRRYRSKPVVVSSRAALIGFLLLNIVGCASSSYDACEDALKRRASASTNTMFNHARADVEKFCEPQEEWPTPYPTSTPTVMEKLDEAIRINPQYPYTYRDRGWAYYKLGQYERAIQDYDEAIRLNSALIPQDPYTLTRSYSDRGLAYAALGQHERAIQDYDEVIRLDPQDAFSYNIRGDAYYKLGQNERAIQDYDEAIRLDPQITYTYSDRGLAYAELGKSVESERDIQNAKFLGYDGSW